MTTTEAIATLAVLTSKVSTFSSYLTSNATELDSSSGQTYFGLPSTVNEDVQKAIALINTAYNKCLALTDPTSSVQGSVV